MRTQAHMQDNYQVQWQVNHELGTIDFVYQNGKEDAVAFRTCSAEAGRVVFQIGPTPTTLTRVLKRVYREHLLLDL